MSGSRASPSANPLRLSLVRPAPEIVPGPSNQVEKPRGTTCEPGCHSPCCALAVPTQAFIRSFILGLVTAGGRGGSASLARSSSFDPASAKRRVGCSAQGLWEMGSWAAGAGSGAVCDPGDRYPQRQRWTSLAAHR